MENRPAVMPRFSNAVSLSLPERGLSLLNLFCVVSFSVQWRGSALRSIVVALSISRMDL